MLSSDQVLGIWSIKKIEPVSFSISHHALEGRPAAGAAARYVVLVC